VVFQEQSYCPYGVRCLFIHEDRTISDMSTSYYGKSLLLDEQTRQRLAHRRLKVFESLASCEE
jgi:Zinc finger C-x8-C-x5-C-x3-H type (and similar)